MLDRILGLAACALVVAGWAGRPARAPAPRSAKYVAQMTGAQETPSNNGKSTGTATFTLDGTKLQYTVLVQDLSGPPTAAHIHVGATGVAGPPVYTFAIKPNSGTGGTISEGTVDLTKDVSAGVSGDSLKVLLNNGSAYVNVHTKNFAGGEIRGQVMTKE
jgi:Cu/Zn superoxide dismutase